MPIFLALAVLFTGGASIAAESSLPGGLLYPIKVGVNEKVGAVFAFSTEAKANYQAKLAGKRAQEMDGLAARGEINSEIAEELKADFEFHAENVNERLNELETNGQLGAAVEVSSAFQAALAARANALADRVALNAGESVQTAAEFSARVERERNRFANIQARLEGEFAVGASADVQAAAEGRMKAAEAKIAEAVGFIESREDSVSAEVYASAQARIDLANNFITDAQARIEAEAYGEAFVLFNRAFFTAVEAQAIITRGINRIRLEEAVNVNVEVGAEQNQPESNTEAEAEAEANAETDGANAEAEAEAEVNVNIGL